MYNVIMNNIREEYTDRYTDRTKKSISDFVLYNSGVEYCEPGYSYGPKRRDYHFIHFVKEGKGYLEINGQNIEVHEDQFFIVPANEISTYTADQEDPWKYSWIGFMGIQSDFFVQSLLQSSENGFVVDCRSTTFYEKKIKKIIELNNTYDLKKDNLSLYFKINSIMYNIVGNLLDEFLPKNDVDTNSTISFQAIRYMDLHYHDDIQISDIANYIGIHPNYLSLKFKNDVGISPKKYLTNLKIKKAETLLIKNDDPIYLIASSVGFSDALAFSKLFKKELGVSPSEFRKDNKNE